MKIKNGIGWCDATTNAVTGCDKVSPGCKNCYAEADTRARVLRAGGVETWGSMGAREPVNFEPVFRRLNKLCVCDCCHTAHDWLDEDGRMARYQCVACGAFALRRIRLFADSNSDWLDPKWPVETLARFLDAIRMATNIDVLLLTKRIENFSRRTIEVYNFERKRNWDEVSGSGTYTALAYWIESWGHGVPPAHVWLGVSVEDQPRVEERVPALLATPAAVRFLSVEPLLDDVDLLFSQSGPHTKESRGPETRIDWVIVGGESGPDGHRRDCGVEAIVHVAAQCVTAGVPVYVKQDCSRPPGQRGRIPISVWGRKEFPK